MIPKFKKHWKIKDKNIDIYLDEEEGLRGVITWEVVIEDKDRMLDRYRVYKTKKAALKSVIKFIKQDRHLIK